MDMQEKSPNNDIDNTSIEKQIEEIEKYCERNDIELVDVYVDDLKSGKTFEGRDEFKEMYNKVLRSDDIDFIIVFKQDRISRDSLDTLYIMKRLNSFNKHIISVADNINTEDPSAKILVHILSLVAELEREFINLRTTSGMEKRADQGRFLGGIVYGYETRNKELIILKEEARIVRYIFEKTLMINGVTKKIASNLNLQGIKTKKIITGQLMQLKQYYKTRYILEILNGKANTKKVSIYLLLNNHFGRKLKK